MPPWWLQQWHQFIFDLANHGAIVFLGTLGIGVFGLGPIGRAIAARIRSGPTGALPPSDPSLPAMKAMLEEALERLDFSERVLTALDQRTGGNPAQLPAKTARVITPV